MSKYSSGEDQAKRERHIEKIKSSVRNLNAILEDFLSLGKLEEGKINIHTEEFDVAEFIFSIIEEMNPLLKPGQHLSVNHTGLTKAASDKRLIKNILINLITNAIKFSDEGSVVQVNVSVAEDVVSFEVIDQGIGIPGDEFEHLFSSFYRARNAINIQGTGLGLHIFKRYLELLQGDILVETELGKGSKFSIQIPQITS